MKTHLPIPPTHATIKGEPARCGNTMPALSDASHMETSMPSENANSARSAPQVDTPSFSGELSPEQLKSMVAEAAALGDSELHHCDSQVQDVVCHVYALTAEVERLQRELAEARALRDDGDRRLQAADAALFREKELRKVDASMAKSAWKTHEQQFADLQKQIDDWKEHYERLDRKVRHGCTDANCAECDK